MAGGALGDPPPLRTRGTAHMATGTSTQAAPSAWSPFHHRTYAVIWTATVVANIGGWMYSAAAAWLMTSLDADPVMVSLVQVATSLPMFLFALPAGALADIIDKRRFLIVVEFGIMMASASFATMVTLDLVTPVTLLLFMFVTVSYTHLRAHETPE